MMLDSITDNYKAQAQPKLVLAKNNYPFKTGEIFSGTVLKRLTSGEVLIKVKGNEFSAKTELKLQPGTRYQFQAVKTGQRNEIKVLDVIKHDLRPLKELWSAWQKDGAKMGDLLRAITQFQSKKGIPATLLKDLSHLSRLLPPFMVTRGDVPNASWFSKFLLASGLFWEARLARSLSDNQRISRGDALFEDLKGRLLSIKHNLISGYSNLVETDSLKEKLDQVLKFLEQEQWLNLSLSRNGLGWYLFIPGMGEEDFKRAEILVEPDKEEGVTRFYLLAHFSKLGAILADFFLNEDTITISFLVENKTIKEFIVENLDGLRESLKRIGFSPGTLSCHMGEEVELYLNRLVEERKSKEDFHLVI